MRHFFDRWWVFFSIVGVGVVFIIFYAATRGMFLPGTYRILGNAFAPSQKPASTVAGASTSLSALTPIDTAAYNAKLLQLANIPTRTITVTVTSTIPGTSTIARTKVTKVVSSTSAWPVKTVYPSAGALLPFNRIVAYYGNFYSTQMGVLGQYQPDIMMAKLASTTATWHEADPSTPVIPALDYIVVTAQGSAGKDGKYRLRMPDSQIDKALELMSKVNGLVFLDFQVGLSDVKTEVSLYESYLKLPNVELSLDPEFDMEAGARPGTQIGTMSASDINWAANYLANLVNENKLPPKILVIHRFTQDMVTNYRQITPLPQVEVVMDMDGWGSPAKKKNTYQQVIVAEPVQFTGFKLFYKNDLLSPSTGMLTPAEVLHLSPQPSYIQYQ